MAVLALRPGVGPGFVEVLVRSDNSTVRRRIRQARVTKLRDATILTLQKLVVVATGGP